MKKLTKKAKAEISIKHDYAVNQLDFALSFGSISREDYETKVKQLDAEFARATGGGK